MTEPKEMTVGQLIDTEKFQEEFYKDHIDQIKNKTILNMTNKPFYRFFAIDYCATGEGMSFWLTICRNYQKIDDRDREKERFVKFIGDGADHYMHGFDELAEDEFLDKYGKLIPDYVIKMIARKDQPAFTWETHLHFNYS